MLITSVAARGPAEGLLQIGDKLVSLNGDSFVAQTGSAFYRSALAAGVRYQLRIERNGKRLDYALTVGTIRQLGFVVSYFFVGLVWYLVAYFIARPGEAVARLALVGSAIVGTWFFVVGPSAPSIVASLIFPVHAVVGYHFFYRFPQGVPAGKVWTGLLWTLYAGAAIAIALGQAFNWIYFTQGPVAATQWATQHLMLYRSQLLFRLATYFLAVRKSLRVWLDRKFFREAHDRDQLLIRLSEDLGKSDSVSSASELVGAQLELAFHPQAVHLFFRENNPVHRCILVPARPDSLQRFFRKPVDLHPRGNRCSS